MIDVSGTFFFQLGIIIIITAIAAFILRLVKQPQILAYVLVGVLLSPLLKLVTDTSLIESMSLVGVAFLLFIVGLEIDIKSLRNVAFVSSLGSTIQIIILFGFGYLISLLLGFLSLEAAYIGLMLSFSSTMVVMKLLSDKRELNTLHGRIVVGTLLTQDVVAILALSILTSVNGFTVVLFGISLVKFVSLFLISYLASKYLFPDFFRFAARHQELLLITSLAVCFLFSLAFYSLGFSIAIGAFLAGVALGSLEYNLEIIGKVRSLKDFFSLLFFVSLGMGLSLGVIKEKWTLLLALLGLVLVLKPIVIMTICSLFKYTKKPSFLSALSLAQIGEFSLILAAQGLALGHISQDLFSLTVIITLVSITLTSYFIQFDQFFYRLLERPLRIFDRFYTEGLEYLPTPARPKIVLCGYNRIGYSILRDLDVVKKKVLIIDYNPEVITQLVREGYHCIYGEVTDDEIIERMGLAQISLLVSTVPDYTDNLFLIRKVKEVNKKASIFVTASDIDSALTLYSHGADYVIMPHFLGGDHVANIISGLREKKIVLHQERNRHITDLKERKQRGQEHPKG